MISLSDDLDIDVSEETMFSDFVTQASRHHWQVSFKFPSSRRHPKQTPTGKKYGSAKAFSTIYSILSSRGQGFIDAYFNEIYPYSYVKDIGDKLLTDINDEIGIVIDSIKTVKDEIFPISRNVKINYTRMSNAEERLNVKREKLDALNDEINSMQYNLKKTKSGEYDRRTSAYKQFRRAIQELDFEYESLYKMRHNLEVEKTRYENSLMREQEAVYNLNRIKDNRWQRMSEKYESSATEFAESIKDDIVSTARIGQLPMQNLGLAEETIRKRLSVGLDAYPRFWATGQLVESIVITCTLV